MSNQQLPLAIGLPMLTIIIGFFIQNMRFDQMDASVKDVRGEVKELRAEMLARFDKVDADFRVFYRDLGNHDKAIEMLEKRPR